MRYFLMFLVHNLRSILAVVLLMTGGYLAYNAVHGGAGRDWAAWLKQSGDSELENYYAQVKDDTQRRALGAVFSTYRRKYGAESWVRKFRSENPTPQGLKYFDLAEIAVGISTDEGREKFLAEHAGVYEACIKFGLFDQAKHYVDMLGRLRDLGGRDWRVAQENSFAICVYGEIQSAKGLTEQARAELWSWYLDNYGWCDHFLTSCNPNENGESDRAGLCEVLAFIKDHQSLLKRFQQEISELSGETMLELAGGEDEEESREEIYASCLAFAGGETLAVMEEILRLNQKILMLEAMTVLSNNGRAFNFTSPNGCRDAARILVELHETKPILWKCAANDFGVDVIRLYREVPAWCEQIVSRYEQMSVVDFLFKYYDDGERHSLVRVASEILYKCQDPGWAVLQKFRDNDQFKDLMVNPRIGFRIVPYYLREGDKVFTDLREDPRWIDEVLDGNGQLKKQDVSWYEVSDIATVVKKMVQNRPISGSVIGWATFELVDLAAMAFTGGASKIATTTVKTGAKTSGKVIGRKITARTMRKVECNLVRRGSSALVRAATGVPRNLSMLKRTAKMFKEVVHKGADGVETVWRSTRNMSPATRRSVYKYAKGLLWVKFWVHTVPDKGPNITRTAMESMGSTMGQMTRAIVAGAGESLKAAVRDAFCVTDSNSLFMKVAGMLIACLLLFCGMKILFYKR